MIHIIHPTVGHEKSPAHQIQVAVVAVVAAALGVEATSVAGAVEMIGRANGWQLGQPGIIFRAGTHGRSNHRRIKPQGQRIQQVKSL